MTIAIRRVPTDQPIIDLDEVEQGRFWSDHWLDDPDDEAEPLIADAVPGPGPSIIVTPRADPALTLLNRLFRIGGPARA